MGPIMWVTWEPDDQAIEFQLRQDHRCAIGSETILEGAEHETTARSGTILNDK